MHAHYWQCLRRLPATNVLQMDHRVTFVRVTLRACLDARFTADAAIGIDEK